MKKLPLNKFYYFFDLRFYMNPSHQIHYWKEDYLKNILLGMPLNDLEAISCLIKDDLFLSIRN